MHYANLFLDHKTAMHDEILLLTASVTVSTQKAVDSVAKMIDEAFSKLESNMDQHQDLRALVVASTQGTTADLVDQYKLIVQDIRDEFNSTVGEMLEKNAAIFIRELRSGPHEEMQDQVAVSTDTP
jgi:hypothetical protein